MIKFFTKNFMVDCIKCLLKVHENPTYIMTIVQLTMDMISNTYKGMVSKVITTKSKLFPINKFIFDKVQVYS